MVQFLMKLLLKQISCCVPKFPLILTAKFHSLYVKESESGAGVGYFGNSDLESGVGYFTSDSATLLKAACVIKCSIGERLMKFQCFEGAPKLTDSYLERNEFSKILYRLDSFTLSLLCSRIYTLNLYAKMLRLFSYSI